LIGIEGALATLKVAIDNDLPNKIKESGSALQDGYNELAEVMELDTKCVGNPARQSITFPSLAHKALFWQECINRGVFLGAAQHTTLAHTNPIISNTLDVFKEALGEARFHWANPKKALEGKLPESVMIQQMRGSNGK